MDLAPPSEMLAHCAAKEIVNIHNELLFEVAAMN